VGARAHVDFPGPAEAVAQFDMAMRQAHVAWTQTPMLARSTAQRVDQVVSAFEGGDPSAIAHLLCDMVGAAFASQGLTGALDVRKAAELGRHLAAIAAGTVSTEATGAAAARVDGLRAVLRQWLETGAHPLAPDLARVNALLDDQPALRLALAAPFAPALEICALVLRARGEGYAFAPGAGRPQGVPA
jgi:hypothetical protein